MNDLVFRGALVVDGTGREPFQGDVTVAAERIAEITDPGRGSGRTVIDADGLVLTPGFIDMHSHSELALLTDPAHLAKILQGVTLEVIGQDGLGCAPISTGTLAHVRSQLSGILGDPPEVDWEWRTIADYIDALDGPTPLNVAVLIPHGNVRLLVIGDQDRAATPSELKAMEHIVEQGMLDGAFGLSTGLTYVPAMFGDTAELVQLCRIVATHGGYFSPHTRNYGAKVFQAYEECIDIARASGVALHLTHAIVNFPENRGKAGRLLAMVDAAIQEGLDVSLDTYPYTEGSSSLGHILPSWCQVGGDEDMRRRLMDPEVRARILEEIEVIGSDGYHGMRVDWNTIVVSGVMDARNVAHVGRSISEIAEEIGRPPGEAYLDLMVSEGSGASCIVKVGNEENVRTIMQHAAHTGGSDGVLAGQRPHPRAWGTFARYIAHYTRDLGVLSLQSCVKHLTGNAAQRLGLADRGTIKVGAYADLVGFSLEDIADRATFDDPRVPASGIHEVVVNGELAVHHGQRTEARAGRALRAQGSSHPSRNRVERMQNL